MATHSSVLAWRIPGMGEPGGLPPMGSHRVGHDWSDLAAAAAAGAQEVKKLPAMGETWVQSLGWEDPLEEGMATHSSILAWKIPWMQEPGRLQSMGSLGVGHDWVTSLSLVGEENGNPLHYSCPESPRDGGAWWAAIYGVTQIRTRLKQLRSSSSLFSMSVSLFLFHK